MKKHIIIDTDIGSDCDDMFALALALAEEKVGSVTLDALTYSSTSPLAPATIRALCKSFGRDSITIGVRPDIDLENRSDHYCKYICAAFCGAADYQKCETALSVLRKYLACAKDKVTLVGIGLFTNFAALLHSGPDEISPLSGVELLQQKCDEVICMAGCFTDNPVYKTEKDKGSRHAEWNVVCDIKAAQDVVSLCPVDLTFLPYEVGYKMLTGRRLVSRFGESTPLTLSFIKFFSSIYGRSSWDPAAVYYAIHGEKDLFIKSKAGKITVSSGGITNFDEEPSGRHFYLTIKDIDTDGEAAEKERIAAVLDAAVERYYEKATNI